MLLTRSSGYIEGNIPAKDYLWRQFEALRPSGVADTTTVVNDYKDAEVAANFVVDDYQAEPDTLISSSGGMVTFDVANVVEGLLNDGDGELDYQASDPMNGMTRANTDNNPDDDQRGTVFDYGAGPDAFLELDVAATEADLSDDAYLSVRACQVSRHPATAAALADLAFAVTLRDGSGTSSTIGIAAYGGGVEEPYQRRAPPAFCRGSANGFGWQNEFEVIRIRLTDFLHDGSGLDLADVRAIRFEFGASFGSPQGAIGLDDVQIVREP